MASVVTHNRKSQLRKTVDAILGQIDADCDLLVVDNGSTDGTSELLDEYAGRGVFRISVGANIGSAGGFHLAVYEAVMMDYDLVWVMDDDVVPDANALSTLLAADEKLQGEWGFLSSYSRWVDGSPCNPNVQKTGVFSFVTVQDYCRELVPVKMAAMASLMIRTEVAKEIGLPIAEYYFYTDDYEYTSRISRQYPCYMVSASKVTHEMSRNEKPSIVDDTADRMWRYEYLYRNDFNCYRKLGLAGWVYLAAKVGYTTADILFRAKGERAAKLGTLWRGVADGMRFNPEIEYVPEAGARP